jgi:hypothetical protein
MGKTARGSPARGGASCGEHLAILPWLRCFRRLCGGRAAAETAREHLRARGTGLAADIEPVDQLLITRFVLGLEIVEEAAPLGNQF